MPLPNAPDYSQRIYELLKETDLENLSYAQFQSVAEKIFIEPENEDEMRRLVLVQLARMAVRGDWDGFLTGGGGGGGAPTDAEYVVMTLDGTLTNERVLTAGTGINISDGGAGGNVTIASTVTGTIEGSIANTQVAVGSGVDTIAGSGSLTYNSATLNVANQIELGDVGAAGVLKNSNNNQDMRIQVAGTGNVRIENQTTNTDSQLNVKGNGSGTPKLSFSNDTKAVTLQCDDNQKLTVKGGTDTFVLDVGSATGGITFPDGTTQTTAASGGGITFPIEADSGSSGAPSYAFSADTDTGIYLSGASNIGITAGGQNYLFIGSLGAVQFNKKALFNAASAAFPNGFATDTNTGFFQPTADTIGFSTAGTERLRFGSSGEILIAGTDAGTNGQVLISTGSGSAVEYSNPKALSGTPASSTATGEAGELQFDTNYLYVCTATNTWKRVSLSSW